MNLRKLADLVAGNPQLPVVTWAGKGADVPVLRDADMRLALDAALESLIARHLDLFLYARSRLRLPTPGLGLKEIARYFGIPRLSSIQDGLQAQLLYAEYRRSDDRRHRAVIRQQLAEYNRDDVENLVEVTERIRAIATQPVQGHQGL